MRYKGTLIAVSNMENSKQFYREILGLGVVADFGANAELDGGIFLQTGQTWKNFIGRDFSYNSGAGELYFEEDCFDDFIFMLEKHDISYVHKAVEHSWGQRAVRFYDPDGHIIEVGENIEAVVRRFIREGMTAQQTAERMDVPLSYVVQIIEKTNLQKKILKKS